MLNNHPKLNLLYRRIRIQEYIIINRIFENKTFEALLRITILANRSIVREKLARNNRMQPLKNILESELQLSKSFTFKRVCSRLEERNSSARLPREKDRQVCLTGEGKRAGWEPSRFRFYPVLRPDRARRRVLGGMRVRWSRPMLT